jgi:hypothetical protein
MRRSLMETPDTEAVETAGQPQKSRSGVAIAAIIVVGVVALIWILACAGVAIAFILNAPW